MRASRILPWLLTVAALGSFVAVQTLYDNTSQGYRASVRKAALRLNEPLVPTTKALKALSLGYPSLTADILWLQTIQYFGSGSPYGNYPSLGPLLERITQLDPKFEYPYEFGLVVLPFMNQTDSAIRLGEAAQKALPNSQLGLIDFYHASNYLLNVKDYQQAAFYYRKSEGEPNHPNAAGNLAGTALNHIDTTLNDRKIAIQYWQAVKENAKTDDARQQAQDWIDQMNIVYQLEQATEYYKEKNNRYPPSLQDLVSAGVVSAIPASPVHRIWGYDATTGKVSFDKLAT